MQRPLVVRFGALGDMVILTVVVQSLYRRFGMPVDILASGRWTMPLLGDQPGVGNIYLIGSRRRPYWMSLEQQALVRQLAARGRGATWVAEVDSAKTLWLLQRAGWQKSDFCSVRDLPDASAEHYCDYLQRLAYLTPASLGQVPIALAAAGSAHCFLEVSPTKREQLTGWLQARGVGDRPYILIQAGNKRTMRRGLRRRASDTKYWAEKNWAAVLHGLRQLHPDHALLLVGAPQESALNDSILRIARVSDAHNLAQELPIPRLMALAERARGMISVDTGPGHVAAAVGCRVVTLFGRLDPAHLAPRGPASLSTPVVGIVDDQRSILGIKPQDVLSAWQGADSSA